MKETTGPMRFTLKSMFPLFFCTLFLATLQNNCSIAQTPIYFEDAVTAILRKNCTACHNAKLAEGGLKLESHADLVRGGDSGPVFDLANVDTSSLLTRPVGDAETIMPPNGNKVGAERLTMEQLAILKSWIAGGALSRGEAPSIVDYSKLHLPEGARASYAVAVSPDSDFIAFGRGGQLVIHDAKRLASASPIAELLKSNPTFVVPNAHPDFIHSISISPDGERIATGSTGQVKIWKRVSSSPDANRVALSSIGIDATKLLSAALDGSRFAIVETVAIADPATLSANPSEAPLNQPNKVKLLGKDGKLLQTLEAPNDRLLVATWSPSGNRFFAIGASNALYSWDLSNPTTSATVTPLAAPSQSVDALDETTLLLTSQRKAMVMQYKTMPTAEPIADHPLAVAINAVGPVDRLSLSADRALACSVTQDETTGNSAIKLWNISQSKLQGSFERDRKQQLTRLNSDRELRRTQASVERSKASVTEQEKALEAEQAAVKAAEANLEKANTAMAAKEKEMQVAASGIAEHEKLMAETKAAIDAATQKLAQLTTELEPKKKAIAELEKQNNDAKGNVANATQALTGIQENQKAAVLKLEERKQRVEKENGVLVSIQTKNEGVKTVSESVRFAVQSLAFVGNNRVAATAMKDKALTNEIELFSVDTLERMSTLPVSQPITNGVELSAITQDNKITWQQESLLDSQSIVLDRATAIAFSPDGKTLAVGSGLASRSGQLALVNVEDGKLVKSMPDLHSDTLLGIAYSPDGRWIASCGADKMTKLLNADSYEISKLFEGHTHHVLGLAWQEDANRLATASSDGTVKIWDLEKGESIKTITGFGNEVTSIAFVGSTANTISASMNKFVRVHDSNSGAQNKQFGPAGDSLYCVVATPNGKYAIAVGQEGIARVWNVDDGKLVAEW